MKTDGLKHGAVLILTRDVKNPKPDRRKTRDFAAAEVWEKGTRLFVEHYEYPRLRHGYSGLYGGSPGWDELVEACEPAPRSLDNILYSLNHSGTLVGYPEEVLSVLCEQGKVTLDDVDAAIAVIREREGNESD